MIENPGWGDSSDGDLTVMSNATNSPHDAVASGSSGSTSLTFSGASSTFASMDGEIILIYQPWGSNAGAREINRIASVSGTTSGTITTTTTLKNTYSGAILIRFKQNKNITVNGGVTYSVKAWNGSVGGVLALLASGIITVTGTLSANGGDGSSGRTSTGGRGTGGGFRGGDFVYNSGAGYCGEGVDGGSNKQEAANSNGGGGGDPVSGGGGGGHATAGQRGRDYGSALLGGYGGEVEGSSDLNPMVFGGGGGGGSGGGSGQGGAGASGGGVILLIAPQITVTGHIYANGGDGGDAPYDTIDNGAGAGGGGAGGSIYLIANSVTLGSGLVTAVGGTKGVASPGDGGDRHGGDGGTGRIYIEACTKSGTTSPTYVSPSYPPSFCASGSLIM